MTEPQKSEDEKRRDEILKRMLKTPPKPHKSEPSKTPEKGKDGKKEASKADR